MEEKKYLKWYNKVGYGSGDIAGNVVFAFLSSFIMIYLTNTVGLNAGVIGSLIAASKVLDGISDVVFGSMIDRTHTKMGKARPWMLGAYFGCAITLIAAFSVPTTMAEKFAITDLLDKKPYELSGGEKQRTAICRALIYNPDLILADEPTGNLDSASSEVVIHTLEEINKKMGKTILLVTHDPIIASSCDRIIFLKDGKVKEDLKRTGDKEQFYNEIITNWC